MKPAQYLVNHKNDFKTIQTETNNLTTNLVLDFVQSDYFKGLDNFTRNVNRMRAKLLIIANKTGNQAILTDYWKGFLKNVINPIKKSTFGDIKTDSVEQNIVQTLPKLTLPVAKPVNTTTNSETKRRGRPAKMKASLVPKETVKMESIVPVKRRGRPRLNPEYKNEKIDVQSHIDNEPTTPVIQKPTPSSKPEQKSSLRVKSVDGRGRKGKKIYIFNKDGKLVKTAKSVSEAAQKLRTSQSNISNAMHKGYKVNRKYTVSDKRDAA